MSELVFRALYQQHARLTNPTNTLTFQKRNSSTVAWVYHVVYTHLTTKRVKTMTSCYDELGFKVSTHPRDVCTETRVEMTGTDVPLCWIDVLRPTTRNTDRKTQVTHKTKYLGPELLLRHTKAFKLGPSVWKCSIEASISSWRRCHRPSRDSAEDGDT